MFTLYHYPLCPASRLIRILLHELEIEFVLERIDFWEKEQIAAKINPSGELPAIADRWGKTFCDLYAILEYLLELHQNSRFSCQDLGARAEMRRMISWVMLKMHQDSTKYILQERVVKRAKKISPQVDVIRTAKSNLLQHLMYLSRMIASRGYLAAEHLTVADFALASQVSVLDFFGDIDWQRFTVLKEWYAPIKSRPSLQKLFSDSIPGITPPQHYADLDF